MIKGTELAGSGCYCGDYLISKGQNWLGLGLTHIKGTELAGSGGSCVLSLVSQTFESSLSSRTVTVASYWQLHLLVNCLWVLNSYEQCGSSN